MSQHALSINRLNKNYKNGVVALREVSLHIDQGDFFALLGPNGAGKTTLIGIIIGLVDKNSGEVRIFDHDIDRQTNLAKRSVGVVPQEFNFHIFEFVEQILIDNAGYYGVPRKVAKPRAEYWLKKLQLWDKRKSQILTLSGGMKRRFMIARAMMHEPKLLILDEPTAGVDIEIRRSIWQFLKQINEAGTTVILTTHYLEEAEQLCKNIGIIHHGELITRANIRDLIAELKVETFLLYLSSPLTDKAIQDDKRVTCRVVDAETVEVDVISPQSINDVFSVLSEYNIRVSSLKNKVNRLEKLFVNLTNR